MPARIIAVNGLSHRKLNDPSLIINDLLKFSSIIPPKTRSGKILRGTVRKIADNEPYKMPATIDDPTILDEIKGDLKKHNILK